MNMEAALQSAGTAGELIEASERLLAGAGLFYGHGTDNPGDEAAALVFTVMGLDHFGSADLYLAPVTEVHREQVAAFLRQRIESREPLPYLLREAWFCGLSFFVDQRVLIPRSPVAELIADRFEPWVEPDTRATCARDRYRKRMHCDSLREGVAPGACDCHGHFGPGAARSRS